MPEKTSEKSTKTKKAYARAGVDIDLADSVKGDLKTTLARASRPEVLGKAGGFGGLFDLSKLQYREPVLVSSVDGVGTKLKLAFSSGRHEGVGQDIVNHCVNDIAVLGAEPLFFLDYVGMGKLEPGVFQGLLAGMAKACRQARCALIGGETAQMPGFYRTGEYDLVGSVVGVVEKKKILSGNAIRPGDRLVGFASNGLHTNGYSLATKIFFNKLRYRMDDRLPGSRQTVADAFLEPHLNYGAHLQRLFSKFNSAATADARKGNGIYGAAHITGGGLTGNIPRILPEDCDASVATDSWFRPPLFEILAQEGGIAFEELHEVFNMGIGMVLVTSAEAAEDIVRSCRRAHQRAWIIGEVAPGKGRVHLH